MKYKITKEQYTRVANKIINAFFKGVEFNPTHPDYENDESLDFSVGGNDLGWIIGPTSRMLTKKCKYELVIYTDTIDEMKNFAPLFRKKLFSKLIIAHFSKLTGLDINCLYMDEFGDGDEDDAFKYRIKKK